MKAGVLIPTFLVITIIFANSGCAKTTVSTSSTCKGTISEPCIVQDTDHHTDQVENYRDPQMILAAYQGNTVGLKELRMSGSAAPSQHDLATIMKNITSRMNGHQKKIIDLDLREESHGYLNEEAITLATENDWINIGKSRQQALADEQAWLDEMSRSPLVYNVLSPSQFKQGDFSSGSTISIKSLRSEQQTAESLGFDYIRMTVTDHMPPNEADVDRFVSLIQHLPSGTWVHIHCRGGKGRTTTFMAMYDMLLNADKVSFDEIIARQASVEPFYDLTKIDEKNSDLNLYYQQRLDFLKLFYQFAKDYRHGYKRRWKQ